MNRNTSVKMRLKREKERRVKEILDAAEVVILNKNFSGATMDDIASEAGITKPTIYQYFKTKDELFVNMIEPLIDSLAEKLKSIRESLERGDYNSGKHVIGDVFNVYYDTLEQDPDLFRLFSIFLQVALVQTISENSALTIKGWGKKCFGEGNRIVKLAVEQELFANNDIKQITNFVWGFFCGIVQVEQNKWGEKGISTDLKPVLKFAENLFNKTLILK